MRHRSAGSNLARAVVAQAGARPQLRLGTVHDQLSIAEATRLAAGRAAALREEGVRPGDRVALVAPTSTDYLVTWLACLLLGAPVALVNPTYPDDLLAQVLAKLEPKLVMREGAVAAARSYPARDPDGLPGLDAGAYDVASFMHTSGTTGLPKFCVQTHDYFRRLAGAMSSALELTPQDRVLAPLPLFHINPMGYGIITALLTGADALTVEKFSASMFWPVVVKEEVTVLVLHAPPVEILKRRTGPADAAGHRVRTMFYADADFLQRFKVPSAVSGYGSTEAAGVTHLARWSASGEIPPDASRHGGRARDDIEWRLDDDGTILVRERERAAMFDGYVSDGGIDPARDADGWFHTGDLGRREGKDRLVFLERAAESIRVKGEFVPVPFVEGHLGTVTGLEDFAVWKRPGALVDEEVVLYLVADPVPLEALTERIAELPAFMRPVALARVATLPRDAAAGKVTRRLLPEQEVLEWVELR